VKLLAIFLILAALAGIPAVPAALAAYHAAAAVHQRSATWEMMQ